MRLDGGVATGKGQAGGARPFALAPLVDFVFVGGAHDRRRGHDELGRLLRLLYCVDQGLGAVGALDALEPSPDVGDGVLGLDVSIGNSASITP